MSLPSLAALAAAAVITGSPALAFARQDAAAAWVKANAIAFKTPVAGSGFDDLAGLDAIIGDARVVSLGEPTHGTREAFQMKHRLLEYLVEKKGFSIFSIEANMPESYALNEYVIDGRGDPKKLIAGMYFWTWRTEEVLAMVEWMKAWNEKNPPGAGGTGKSRLQFTGFDMQTPDEAADIAGDFARKHAPELWEKYKTLRKDLKAVTAAGSLGTTARGWTSTTGTLPVGALKGKKLRFSCWIRTENVSEWVGAWVRYDTPAGVNGFNNMQDREIKGTTEWTRQEFTIDVPADVQGINFGFILAGDGAAWFDDVEVELDGAKWDDPTLYSFDFEDDNVNFLSRVSGEYTSTRSEARPHAGKKSLEIRRRPEAEVPKIDPQAVLARAEAFVADLTARRDELITKTSAKDTDWAIQNARVVAQCASMYARQDGFNVRDESMALNVRWILDQNPGQKIVLWAHNGHVSRAGYMGMVSMGKSLSDALGNQMVVFGFATGTGTYTAASQGGGGLKNDHMLVAPGEESVEAVFTASGLPNAILDIRKAKAADPATEWATKQMAMRSIGALAMDRQFFACVPKDAYDVLVWQAETTAARTLK